MACWRRCFRREERQLNTHNHTQHHTTHTTKTHINTSTHQHNNNPFNPLTKGRVPFEDWMRERLGFDLELKAYEWVRMLRCMPWWDSYASERAALGDRKTPPLDGFHHLLRGIELDKVSE